MKIPRRHPLNELNELSKNDINTYFMSIKERLETIFKKKKIQTDVLTVSKENLPDIDVKQNGTTKPRHASPGVRFIVGGKYGITKTPDDDF